MADEQRPAPFLAPRAVTEFVGRAEELARLGELLVPGRRVGIAGLVGMGGLGKTELAKLAAERAADRFRDGVLWADCGAQSPGTIANSWAGAYGVQLAGDDETSKLAGWRSLGCQKEALLIFDDVQPEQGIEALIPPRGRCSVLLTTRYGAHPALLDAARLDLETFTPEEAVALVDKVMGSGTAPAQQEESIRLFALTGFLPLALDVALQLAKRCGWRLEALNQQLEAKGALRVLRDEKRLNRSLWATFEMAWENLPAQLAEVFASLPVFRAGASFSTAAMAAVIDRDEAVAGERLHRLAGRSLVKRLGEGRWGVHPLAEEFAETRGGVDEASRERMARYYQQVSKTANDLYLTGGEGVHRGLALFDLERGHIEAGQAWAGTRAQVDGEAARLCSAYADVGAYVLALRLHPRVWLEWLEASVRAMGQMSDRHAERWRLSNLGMAHVALGDARRAIEYYKQGLALTRELGDRRAEAAELGNLGNAYRYLGDPQQAIACYEQALTISREIGDRRREAARLGNLGLAYANLDDMPCAIACYEQGLEISRAIGDRRREATRLGNLGVAYGALGNAQRAIEYHVQALAISREIGDRRAEGNELGNLGLAYYRLGDARAAIGYYEQSLEIRREIEDRRGEGIDLANMGEAWKKLGEVTRARALWMDALRICEAIEDPRAQSVRDRLAEIEGESA